MTATDGDRAAAVPAFGMSGNMPVGMYVAEMLPDGTRRFVFVSDRLVHMLGLDRGALMRDWRTVYANVHPDDLAGFLEPSEESWNGVAVFRWEGRAYVRGEIRWFLAESNPRSRSGGGAYWDGVIVDVTDRRQAEARAEDARRRELETAHERLRDLERSMKCSMMAAAVAHDVKQPLAAALFCVERLLERFRGEPVVEEVRALVDHLAQEAILVADSVDRLQGLLRSVETTPAPFDLGHVCRSAARVVEGRASRRRVRLEVTLPRDPLIVVGDAAQMQVAVVNLLANAVRAVAEFEGDSGMVHLELRSGDRDIECVVGDSGPGYQPGEVRGGGSITDHAAGTGMGLLIVRAVADNHRGRLDIGRSPLGGAEFRILLPRDASPAFQSRS